MRSPSGSAPGSTRGIAPVAIRIASGSICSPAACTVLGPARRPGAAMTLTPSAASLAAMSADWALARSVILLYRRAALTVARPPLAMPSPADLLSRAIALEVSMSALEGTQSVSTQAPPSPSESTTVTSAPSWTATRAASYPPGPPPRMAILRRCKVTMSNSPGFVVAVRYRAPGMCGVHQPLLDQGGVPVRPGGRDERAGHRGHGLLRLRLPGPRLPARRHDLDGAGQGGLVDRDLLRRAQ